MNRTFTILTTMIICSLMLMVSCKKPTEDPTEFGNDAWILNEGSWGSNNACLDALDTRSGEKVGDHVFQMQNGRGLGDIAQDMITIDDKLFISVSESNTIEVVDIYTGKSIKQIDMGNRYPRYMTTDGKKLYVSCYSPHSVVRIDPTSYSIESTCELTGFMQPEQMCYFDGKLYVCSSWQSNESGAYEYDNKLAVVDVASFTLTDSITVGYNPCRIMGVDNSRLIVAYSGNYASEVAGCALVNVNTKQTTVLPVSLSNFDRLLGSEWVIGYASSYDANWNSITEFYKININTLEFQKILTDVNGLNAYGININPNNGHILVCNGPYGSNGDIYCFDSDGKTQLWKCDANIFPSKIVWIPQVSDTEE